MGYSSWGHEESDTTGQLHNFTTFFILQLSHPYMTTGKTIALTRMEVAQVNTAWTHCLYLRFIVLVK